MRLIKLSANHESFKTVNFRPYGITLVVGSQSKSGETYNGVGKSLIIQLVNFCLGARANEQFADKLKTWEFTLEFDLDGTHHTVARGTQSQNIMRLNEADMTLKAFNLWMGERAFAIPDEIAGMSFRSLLPKFLRRGNAEYVKPLHTGEATDLAEILHNAFLLGLEAALVTRKAALRKEISRIAVLRKNFKVDDLLKDFSSGGKDAGIHLSYLDQRIQALEKDKVAFVVAENYHELRKSADELSEQIARDTNTSFLLRATVENIEISIREQPDLPIERLHALYGELTQNFKPEALKRLEDVADFHRRMLANRIARLSREKLKLLDSLKFLEANLRKARVELDKRMQTLGETRALDQYTALVSQISDLKAQAQKLRDYQAMEREYSDKEAGLKVLMSEEVVATNAYLDDAKPERERNFRVFSDFAAEFYPNKIAGISVHNNTGDNLIRFDIAVHIENDTSDGINEVRIFCYDLTLLTLRMGHRIDFVFHDSRLFANMDVRQRAVLFKLAHRVTKKNGLQYIATLNPDFIFGMEKEFQPEELKEIIVDNIVLELKDSSPEDKLLGINVDMNYE